MCITDATRAYSTTVLAFAGTNNRHRKPRSCKILRVITVLSCRYCGRHRGDGRNTLTATVTRSTDHPVCEATHETSPQVAPLTWTRALAGDDTWSPWFSQGAVPPGSFLLSLPSRQRSALSRHSPRLKDRFPPRSTCSERSPHRWLHLHRSPPARSPPCRSIAGRLPEGLSPDRGLTAVVYMRCLCAGSSPRSLWASLPSS